MTSVREADVSGKRVFVRAGFDVPIDGRGEITDSSRIISGLQTIAFLLINGARVIVGTHLDRPGGKTVEKLRLRRVAEKLEEFLQTRLTGARVIYSRDIVGGELPDLLAAQQPNEVLMLENLRFDAGEEGNSPVFARGLAAISDIYVNDAFSDCHRDHASIVGVPRLLPSYAGLQLEQEITTLSGLLERPMRPFVAILGGVKAEEKLPVIENLKDMVDRFLVGGVVANTFLKAKGMDVKNSVVAEEELGEARKLLKTIPEKIVLPTDFKWDKEGRIADIGPKTVADFEKAIKHSSMIFWNGNMGISELPEFAEGTQNIARAVASHHATAVVGGGDTVVALDELGLREKVTFVSTGGGSTLEFLAGRPLPGLIALGWKKTR
jgi:phosphoglycerate kinase